ncbi:tetratricopeptide repeat protein [Streptomyces sp. CB01881]|uniref:tetratricopeptide repeat protein n=1 Tax=Streptomyces sp. CB01881 TaxID=2078691 RepID=UPI0011DFAB85|nr:tetratricopeptide repeat protein [Streptomyces sp. CB01881]TYC66652.1 tetratricopeptide repeat protein [Streptomyces sp. CB01881]
MQASNHSFAVGHADQVAYYAGRHAPAAWPHQVGAVPTTAHCFRRRAVLDTPDTPARCRILVGTVGAGKTQLAANEARTAWQAGQLDLLVWVTAGSRAAILTAYAQAIAEITGRDPADPEQGAREFLAWLRPGGAGETIRRLIVLDGVLDPDDLRGLWPPDQPAGRTLITTWRRDLAREGLGRQVVAVPSFGSAEAVDHLTALLAAFGRSEPPEHLEALARELGHLPLALAQAAAHLGSTGMGCADYLRLLGDDGRQLADLVPDEGGLPDEQSLPLPHAWDLALERADALAPVGTARRLLELLAPLSSDGIPAAVLADAVTYLDQQRTERPATDEEPDGGAEGTLALLHRWSLLDHDPADRDRSARVHPMVQRAVRESVPASRAAGLADVAADLLFIASRKSADAANAGRYYTVPLRRQAWLPRSRVLDFAPDVLRSNVEALTRRDRGLMLGSGEPGLRCGWSTGQELHALVFRVGDTLADDGRPQAALDYFEALLPTTADRLGARHESVTKLRGRIARLRAESGDVTAAITEYRRMIDDQLALLAPEYALHPSQRGRLVEEVTGLRHRLAHWLEQAGDLPGVARVYRDLLADDDYIEAVGGRRGPLDPTLRHDAAEWQGRAGDAAGAAVMYGRLVNERFHPHAPVDPGIFETRFSFGHWLGESGDARGAVTVLTDLLNDQLRLESRAIARGTRDTWSNPYAVATNTDRSAIFRTRAALARWRGQSGDRRGAVALLSDLLNEQLRVLRPDHPDLATTRQALAYWQEQSRGRRWLRGR